MIDREQLLDHINWVLRPPVVQGWLLDQCTEAIKLVAAGRGEGVIEIDCKRRTAAEAVEIWELEEFVVRDRKPQAADM